VFQPVFAPRIDRFFSQSYPIRNNEFNRNMGHLEVYAGEWSSICKPDCLRVCPPRCYANVRGG
jgi:hypothetical protein